KYCCLLTTALPSLVYPGLTIRSNHRRSLHAGVVRIFHPGKMHAPRSRMTSEDYFIAQGRGVDEIQDKKNLYSFNCMDWFLLPPATGSMMAKVAKAAKGHFMGDPSYVYEHIEISRQGDREEQLVTKVNEESRLAVTIHQIEEEVAVIPRGAFIKSPQDLVQINRSFCGLSESEARKLDNFLHCREPKNLKKRSILEMGDYNPAIDFLEVLSDDIPKGENSQSCFINVIRSNLWPYGVLQICCV
uniref:Radial spoke head protein 9 homolog n=1 Tax=Mola mola TaxID=94237 RepID=A0A3Q3WFA3_MOLML